MKETLPFNLGYFGLQLYYTTKLNKKKKEPKRGGGAHVLLEQNPDRRAFPLLCICFFVLLHQPPKP